MTVMDSNKQPEVVKIRRGPYTARVRVFKTDDGIKVGGIGFEQHRPAVAKPTTFFNLSRLNNPEFIKQCS